MPESQPGEGNNSRGSKGQIETGTVLLPSPIRLPQPPCCLALARSGTNSSVRAPIRASRAVQPPKARIPPAPKPRPQVSRIPSKQALGGSKPSRAARRPTIAIAIEVIAFGEIRCLRYGRANTAPASDPTPTHVKTRPSWAAESCNSLKRDHGQERRDDRDNKRKEHVPEKDDLHALRVTSVAQRTDERFREVFAEPGRRAFGAVSTAI